jgi:hypothetical protein
VSNERSRQPATSLVLAGIGAAAVLAAVLVTGADPATAAAVVTSALVVEYGAVAVAIALGIDPLAASALVGTVGFFLILVLFAALDLLESRSALVRRLTARAQARSGTVRHLERIGLVGLVPGVMIVGIYVCVPLAWLFGWRRGYALLALCGGYIVAIAVTAGVAVGLVSFF